MSYNEAMLKEYEKPRNNGANLFLVCIAVGVSAAVVVGLYVMTNVSDNTIYDMTYPEGSVWRAIDQETCRILNQTSQSTERMADMRADQSWFYGCMTFPFSYGVMALVVSVYYQKKYGR